MPPSTGIRDIYNGTIPNMRKEGYTLQEIGNTMGVTRERIRQILARFYGNAKTDLLPEGRVAKIIGCNSHRLEKLRKQGVLTPRHTSYDWLYSKEEIEKAISLLQGKLCVYCNQPIPLKKHLSKYCEVCSKERRRYGYPFLSPQTKAKAALKAKDWMKRNPEKTIEMNRRASQKYEAKKRLEHYTNTKYKIVHLPAEPQGVLSVGAIVRAVGCRNSHLILENGMTIPSLFVRRIR